MSIFCSGIRIILITVAFLFTTAGNAAGWSNEFERLRFDINWLFIPGGTAIIQADRVDAQTALFNIEACSLPSLDMFYKVRDQIISRVHIVKSGYDAAHFRFTQLEGRRKRNFEVSFAEPQIAILKNHQQGTQTSFPIPHGAVDMVTAFFKTRQLPLHPGKTYQVPVFDHGKSYLLDIQVIGKEVLDTVLSDQTNTIRIRPKFQSDGIFIRTGEIDIWLTDDHRHLPVRMTSKIKIGKIVAELAEISYHREPSTDQKLLCEAG